MDPIDRTFLAQTGGACRTAVAASKLPRAGTRREVLGTRVWVVTHKVRGFCKSVERLSWAKASGCPWVARTCVAQGGLLEVLRWARQHDCPWGSMTCLFAAYGGHLAGRARRKGSEYEYRTEPVYRNYLFPQILRLRGVFRRKYPFARAAPQA